jgi:predicted DNA-binding transcriptional regulator YafY
MTSTVILENSMRASRLLQILLLLQNRGRMTCAVLAKELEVAQRTIMRDVDALSEAGLPIVVLRGNQGGIELGFNYRTRLTGLATDEAEALAVILFQKSTALVQLGMQTSGNRAIAKLVESLPDGVREHVQSARQRFQLTHATPATEDPRIAALALAVRERRVVYVRATSSRRQRIEPVGLLLQSAAWYIRDQINPSVQMDVADCGDINISAKRF